jgi:hypothetical protein
MDGIFSARRIAHVGHPRLRRSCPFRELLLLHRLVRPTGTHGATTPHDYCRSTGSSVSLNSLTEIVCLTPIRAMPALHVHVHILKDLRTHPDCFHNYRPDEARVSCFRDRNHQSSTSVDCHAHSNQHHHVKVIHFTPLPPHLPRPLRKSDARSARPLCPLRGTRECDHSCKFVLEEEPFERHRLAHEQERVGVWRKVLVPKAVAGVDLSKQVVSCIIGATD